MKRQHIGTSVALAAMFACVGTTLAFAQDAEFNALVKELQARQPEFAQRHQKLLAERYDLSDRPAKGVTMSRGKPVQEGVRARLPQGMTWEKLAALTPAEIKAGNHWPAGFYPLPHPHHEAGGMVFPKTQIDEIKKQEGRDLARFDLDYDLPQNLLPEFPAPIYLTTRPDLGDVSKGQLVTIANYYDLFKGALNPKQLEGLRLLVTPFPQQQFNSTDDRRSLHATTGVTCFDCHANGHTNAATHTAGDIRPNEHRIGSTLRHSGESMCNVCSDHNGHSRQSRTSPSLNNVPPTSMVTSLQLRRRVSILWNAAAKFISWLSSRHFSTFHRPPS